MYFITILLLLLIFPIASTAIEALAFGHTLSTSAMKWFVFWPMLRLLIAGIRQVMQPAFTARDIFHIEDRSAFGIVRELGFANFAMGSLGALSLVWPQLLFGGAFVGGIYYALAGLGHIPHARGNSKRTMAMISDLAIAVVLVLIAWKAV